MVAIGSCEGRKGEECLKKERIKMLFVFVFVFIFYFILFFVFVGVQPDVVAMRL